MLCDNCGKREANVKYSENINGRKKELNLCEECSHKLGIDQMDFSMPIDFSNFFEGFNAGIIIKIFLFKIDNILIYIFSNNILGNVSNSP